MPPEPVSAWLSHVSAWLRDSVEVKWLFGAAGPGDNAFLGVIFALNAGFASIDTITEGFMASLRDDVAMITAKYGDPKWLKNLEKEIPATDMPGLEKIAGLVAEALALNGRIPWLFKAKAKFWKGAMGVCAAVSLVCMAIPYAGRILLLLALPVPLFVLGCLDESRAFRKEAKKKCHEIEDGVRRLKVIRHPETMNDEVLARLGNVEKTLEVLIAKLDAANLSPNASSKSQPPASPDGK